MSQTISRKPTLLRVHLIDRVTQLFNHIPYWLVALTARVALAQVFWSSAQTHLANWDTTLYMFSNSYQVPLLPPVLSAYMAVTMEVVTPPLLLLGLATRFTALALFGMTSVIEIFVYPQAWPTHIQWVAMMLVLMSQGAGLLSVDTLIKRFLTKAS
ncbi:MAG TPA: DoxX family protein [Halothiobacillus sp.]|nr:MAG: DoxX family protein [Acidocella sp. 20-61-6]HQT43122.1 DoxX family protein [Halothiobacillus sp.]